MLARHRRAGPGGPARQGKGVVVLERVHRYGGGIAALAEAIRHGDGDAHGGGAPRRAGRGTWLPIDVDETEAGCELVRERAVAAGLAVVGAAREGDAHGGARRRSGGSGCCAPTAAVPTA